MNLRSFATSKKVSVRVRNVIGSLPDDCELMQLSLEDARSSWIEIETMLMGQRAFGRGSLSQLRAALDLEFGDIPTNDGINPGISLTTFARSTHVPRRVRNVFRKLPPDHPFIEFTLQEAWDRWHELASYLTSRPSFGAKSHEELRSCMQKHSGPTPAYSMEHPFSKWPASWFLEHIPGSRSTTRTRLHATIEELHADDLLDHLRSGIIESNDLSLKLAEQTHGFLIATSKWFDPTSGRTPRLTRQGISDLVEWARHANAALDHGWLALSAVMQNSIKGDIWKYLAYHDLCDEDLASRLFSSHDLTNADSRNSFLESGSLAHIFTMLEEATHEEDTAPAPFSLDVIQQILLLGESPRNRELIALRISTMSTGDETLDSIGNHFDLTRERVRQIVLRWKISIAADGRRDFVNNQWTLIEPELNGRLKPQLGDLQVSSIKDAAKHVDAKLRFIMGSTLWIPNLESWMERNAIIVDKRLVWIECNNEQIEELACFLDSNVVGSADFPVLLSSLSGSPAHCESSIHFTPQIRNGELKLIHTERGLMLSRDLRVATVTDAHVHAVFESDPDWILSSRKLWNEVRKLTARTGSCRSLHRKIRSALRSHPSRYRQIHGFGWLDMEDLLNTEDTCLDPRPHLIEAIAPGDIDSTMGKTVRELYDLLSNQGAATLTDIGKKWARHKRSESGVSGLFHTIHPCFITVHPGLKGCLDADGRLCNPELIRKLMLNQETLTQYLRLRCSGHSPHDYPAWDKIMLAEWKDWAIENVDDDMLSGIVDQLEYDIKWTETPNSPVMAANLPLLEKSGMPANNRVPEPADILSILAVGLRYGFINWHMVNLCNIGLRAGGHRPTAMLATLIAAGAVKSPRHWQYPHPLTAEARDILDALLKSAQRDCEITWCNNDATSLLNNRIQECWNKHIPDSWVDLGQARRLVKAIEVTHHGDDPYYLLDDHHRQGDSPALALKHHGLHIPDDFYIELD